MSSTIYRVSASIICFLLLRELTRARSGTGFAHPSGFASADVVQDALARSAFALVPLGPGYEKDPLPDGASGLVVWEPPGPHADRGGRAEMAAGALDAASLSPSFRLHPFLACNAT